MAWIRGKKNFFFINNQQIHVDAFANQHNEITSVIFNSNTNVILGILGGCMIYVALYTTKNTHDEDIKDYAKAGKQMMRRIIAEYGDNLDQLDDAERKKNWS